MGRCQRRTPGHFCHPYCGLAAVVLLLAAGAAGAAVPSEEQAPPLRRLGFGWDPAETGSGLTVRYRISPRWDLGLAAGPNDYLRDSGRQSWDDDDQAIDDGQPEDQDDRREQGWVRLAAGRNFWREGRLAVSGVGAVTYRWSAEEYRTRYYRSYSGAIWDFNNHRNSYDYDTWSMALGIRPSFQVTSRAQVEFEAGLEFERVTVEYESLDWWDTSSGTELMQETRHERTFRSYGGFEFYRLKFIFWF